MQSERSHGQVRTKNDIRNWSEAEAEEAEAEELWSGKKKTKF